MNKITTSQEIILLALYIVPNEIKMDIKSKII